MFRDAFRTRFLLGYFWAVYNHIFCETIFPTFIHAFFIFPPSSFLENSHILRSVRWPLCARDIWWTLDFASPFLPPGVNSRADLFARGLLHAQLKAGQSVILNRFLQGRRKHRTIGGRGSTGFQGHFWIMKRAAKKFSRNCWRHTVTILHVFD